MDDQDTDELAIALEQLDQTAVFEKAFSYVKNKTKKDYVSATDLMYYLNKEREIANSQYKFSLGFTAIALLRENQTENNRNEINTLTKQIVDYMV